MRIIEGTAVFGEPDEPTLAQIGNVAKQAERTVLCADAHVGYVMPIGGVAAYRDRVSVVGVGFDIACLAAGTPVVTADGCHVPIEAVARRTPATCWDGERVRPVAPHFGAVARGVRPTLALTLANGRTLRLTADHRVRTRDGWREAGTLRPGDAVACVPFVGLPRVPVAGALGVPLGDAEAAARLADRGLWPVETGSPAFPALLRVLGYVNGDGHLTRDGKRVLVYTTDERDAAEIAGDFAALGFAAHVYRRARGPGRRDELHVTVDSTALHALLAALGAPVGRTAWPDAPMTWLLELPAWMRAQYLSAFASAAMTVAPDVTLSRAGGEARAVGLVARLLASLDFEASVAPRGSACLLQLLGGQAAQLRFIDTVGFCRARGKREAAAQVASVAWVRGAARRQPVERIATDFDGFLRIAPPQRGAPHGRATRSSAWVRNDPLRSVKIRRDPFHDHMEARLPGSPTRADCAGEACWVPVASVARGREEPVFDVVTGDPAESFLASGVVVHNCGNAAIRTDLTVESLGESERRRRQLLTEVADAIQNSISFGVGRKNRADDAPVDDPLFADPAWDAVPAKERQALKAKARGQLGTVGSGNHYVDVFADERGRLWVGVHFGSRGFGHGVASGFLAMAQGKGWSERAPETEVLLDVNAPIGHDYWQLMNLAGRYAYAGREWVARKVVELLGGQELELVHNHHNFAWKEKHDGEEYLVVRKGATPAFPGQTGFVGGSMGDDAVIIRGTPNAPPEVAEQQRRALYSTVHGAGRVMSRTQAAGKRNRRTGKVLSPGRVTPEMMKEWIGEKGVILRGGGLDESPHVYRRLPEVLAAQGGTIEVLHTLRPLVVVMAGADEFDPYKD